MTTILIGDLSGGFSLLRNKSGKNQTLIGTDNDSINIIFGDAVFMYDRSNGGHDTLQGGDNSSGNLINDLVGDAAEMFDSSKGGNDTLQGGDNSGGILIDV